MTMWNLWHGCHKKSEGCLNCYMFKGDAKRGNNPEAIHKTNLFNAPITKNRKKEYKIKSGSMIWTCFTSDFFIEEADEWRDEAWQMMRERNDCTFFFITKRPERVMYCLPDDWGMAYDHVQIGVTMENQLRVNERLPILKSLPFKHKTIILEPMLEDIDISSYLDSSINRVVCGGESGYKARPCNFAWIENVRSQCNNVGVSFWFKQTGYRFIKDNKMYLIDRRHQHAQARKATELWKDSVTRVSDYNKEKR